VFTEGVILWLSTGNNMNETLFLLHDFCELYHTWSFVHQYWPLFLQAYNHSKCVVLFNEELIINNHLLNMHLVYLLYLS